MKLIERLREDELRGVRYAVNVFVASDHDDEDQKQEETEEKHNDGETCRNR